MTDDPPAIQLAPSAKQLIEPFWDEFHQALQAPTVEIALRIAQASAASLRESPPGPESDRLAAEALAETVALAETLGAAAPDLADALGAPQLWNLCRSLVVQDPLADLRARTVPGYPGRPLWLLNSVESRDAFLRYLAPGQIWVEATQLTRDQYEQLWGLVRYQQEAGLGRSPDVGGRPRGTRSAARQELIDVVHRHPDWTDRKIFSAGLTHGQRSGSWTDNPDAHRAWVRRIRKGASVTRLRPRKETGR